MTSDKCRAVQHTINTVNSKNIQVTVCNVKSTKVNGKHIKINGKHVTVNGTIF